MTQLSEVLAACMTSRMVILGIGNRLKGDDGAGSLLAEGLSQRVSCPVFDTGEVPESYAGKVKESNPEVILLIDLVNMGMEPGYVAVFKPEDLKGKGTPSTHRMSLTILANYLRKETGAEVYLLGIQPKSTGFGEMMCEEVQRSAEILEDTLASCLEAEEVVKADIEATSVEH